MIKNLQMLLILITTIFGVYLAHSEELVVDSDMGNMISGLRGNDKPTKAKPAQTDPSLASQELGPEGKETIKPESTTRKIRYMVREGDTLEGVAKRFQLSVQEILDINGLVESANVIPGQFLIIPLRVKGPRVGIGREGEEAIEGPAPEAPVSENLVLEEDEAELQTQRRGGESIAGGEEQQGVSEEGPAKSQLSPGEEIVNLQTEMDLRDLIQTMSEITGEAFILDDSVRGKRVTIITPQGGFKKENTLRLFETILDLNGFSIVKKDGINKIVQKRDIKTESIPTEVGSAAGEASERFITRIVPLENIQASDVANILKPLISREGDIAVYPDLNSLIIVETRSNINRLLDIIANLDLKKEIEFVQIVNTDAADVAAKLLEIFGGTGSIPAAQAPAQPSPRERRTAPSRAQQRAQSQVSSIPASGQSALAGFKVIVDERTNTLIVIAYPEDLAKINTIIKKLDVETEEPEEGIYVVRLLNADAEQVVSVISSLLGGGGVVTPSQAIGGTTRRTGISRVGGGTLGQTVTGRGAYGQTLTGQLQGQQITRGETTGPSTAAISAATEEGLRITADSATNSIIIVGSRRDYEAVRRVIEELDVRRKQVFVETAILEVSLSSITALGTSLSIGFTFNSGQDLGFGGTILPGVPSLLGLAADPAASLNLATSLSGLFLGVIGEEVDPDGSGPIPPIPSFTALFQALTSLTDVNVLSTPSIITTDNEEAEIVVADVIPFPTGSVIGDAGVTVQTIDRQPVGIRLAITPQIGEGDYLNLNIFTEVSSVAPTPADLNTAEFGIATNTRTADSSVVVRNGQTIVIGGLVQDRESTVQNKVPLLGSIPILGNLFKFKRF
ncbi:MAG: type II secretion system secretin GspD, partial [Deltaproteobacteria bacterium]|nr:type II secretion system secretin GspD [Deltaproteobacteria bacterium]